MAAAFHSFELALRQVEERVTLLHRMASDAREHGYTERAEIYDDLSTTWQVCSEALAKAAALDVEVFSGDAAEWRTRTS